MDKFLLTQIGVGGIFCILVLREVFAFVGRTTSKGDGNQKQVVTRDELDRKLSTVQYVDNCQQIVKRFDTMLETIVSQRKEDMEAQKENRRMQDEQFDKMIVRLIKLQDLISEKKDGN